MILWGADGLFDFNFLCIKAKTYMENIIMKTNIFLKSIYNCNQIF